MRVFFLAVRIALPLLLVASGCGSDNSFGVGEDTSPTADTGGGGDAATTEDTPVAPPPLGEPEWRLVEEFGQGATIWKGISGATTGDGFLVALVGSDGSVALFDSATGAWDWRNVGEALAVNGVWIEDRDTLAVIGDEGLARRWDSTSKTWLNEPIVGVDVELYDIWGDRATGQFVCGDRGFIARWNPLPERWDVEFAPGAGMTNDRKLRAVWGTAPDDVFVVGNRLVMHWDGSEWTATEVEHQLYGVYAVANGPVYAVGDAGLILTLDRGAGATDWVAAEGTGFLPYREVFGVGAEHVWVAGYNTMLTTRTDSGWAFAPIEAKPGSPPDARIPPDLKLQGIWGTDPDNLFLIGDGPEVVRRARYVIE